MSAEALLATAEHNARDEIAELVHRYADAVTRRDIPSWTACWASDATWSLRPDRTAVGLDQIVARLHSALASLEGVVQNVLNGSVRVDGPSGSAASGRWYIQEHLRRVTGEPMLLLAHYDDTYTKQDSRWCFASRTLVMHYQGPPDLSGEFSTATESSKEGRTP